MLSMFVGSGIAVVGFGGAKIVRNIREDDDITLYHVDDDSSMIKLVEKN